MSDELTLPEIKEISFEILMHFKSFCEENGIRYFLSNGTLLGAVKYGGFIPWDDDIDVLIPRDDYERLLRIYSSDGKYILYSPLKNPDFRYPYAKLCDVTTIKQEKNINNGMTLGIDIDVLPLDFCSRHIFRKGVLARLKIYQTGSMLSKFMSSGGKSFVKRTVIDLCRLLGYGFFRKGLEKLGSKERVLGNSHMGCLTWPIYGKREFLPAEVFADTVTISFEGEIFPAPIGYDRYLRNLYGNYREDPPINKQKTHHNFSAYRKTAYQKRILNNENNEAIFHNHG